MEQEEIKELLPFFVAGTLEDGERRAVEEGLQQHPSLRSDLEFWKQSRKAVLSQAAFAREGHPATEDLEAFASWSLTDKDRRAEIEDHLRGCSTCEEAFILLKEMEHVPEPVEPGIFERLAMAVRSVRLVVAVPVMTMMLVAGFFAYRVWQGSREFRPLEVTLTYERTTRSASSDVPLISIGENSGPITIRTAVPHNPDVSSRYTVLLRDSAGATSRLAGRLAPFHRGLPYDSLLVTADPTLFASGLHRYSLLVQRDNPPDAHYSFTLPFDTKLR